MVEALGAGSGLATCIPGASTQVVIVRRPFSRGKLVFELTFAEFTFRPLAKSLHISVVEAL